jgi:hypothetical protein
LPTPRGIRFIWAVSTVSEIESALEKLPVGKQREVVAWLEAKLWPETPAMLAAIDEAERSLAEEGGVPVEAVRGELLRKSASFEGCQGHSLPQGGRLTPAMDGLPSVPLKLPSVPCLPHPTAI